MDKGYIFSAKKDWLIFFGPLVISYLFCVLAFQYELTFSSIAPPWIYIILHIVADGSHIYGTLYRVYFDRREFRKRPFLYTMIPVGVFTSAFILFFVSKKIAIYCLAYLAIFHFIRQQFGWMMIAANKSKSENKFFDKLAIYNATVVPTLYWFMNPTSYGWFEPNDTLSIDLSIEYSQALLFLHVLIFIVYFAREYSTINKTKTFPTAKYLILFCTWMTWFPALVIFRTHVTGLILLALNHGTQYLALVYAYSTKRYKNRIIQNRFWPIIFYLSLATIATIEITQISEFSIVIFLKKFVTFVNDDIYFALGWAIITLPQITHYMLDGFIWKTSNQNNELNEIIGRV